MGGRTATAAAADEAELPQLLRIGGDSSPSSSESTFRELDHVFLQNQTRIWLGEVLQRRLPEQLDISDLLADGELLFEVSRVAWKMLLMNQKELKHIKAYKSELFATRKSSGRYTPYSNVDSFLKICKLLGLTGIDLFSPSDVVEKRETRKVCMCIRSLSKKARFKHLNVPDFDIVTYTVAMPTDMVGCIRRSLELSQCCFSSSASYNPHKDLRAKFGQKNSSTASATNYDLYSEGSDDAESNYVEVRSNSSSTNCSYDSTSQPVGHDRHLDNVSSASCNDKQNHPSGRAFHIKNGFRQSHENGAQDLNYINPGLGDGVSFPGDSMDGNTPERRYIARRLATSNVNFHGADNSGSIMFDGECSILDPFTSTNSQRSNSTQGTFGNGHGKLSDVDDGDVSSIASMCSVSGAVMKFDFEDQFDMENDFGGIQFPGPRNDEPDLLNSRTMRGYESQDIVEYENPVHNITPDSEKTLFDMKSVNDSFSSKHFLECPDPQSCTTGYLDYVLSDNNVVCMSNVNLRFARDEGKLPLIDSKALNNVDCDQGKGLLSDLSHFPCDFREWDHKGKCAIAAASSGDDGHRASPKYVSQKSSHGETLHRVPTKLMGDVFLLKDMKSVFAYDDEVVCPIVIESNSSASKQSNNYFQLDYEDSSALCNIVAVINNQVRNKSETVTVDTLSVHNNLVIPANPSEPSPDMHCCSSIECSGNVDEKGHQTDTDHHKDLYCVENVDKVHSLVEREIDKDENSNGTEQAGESTQEYKPGRRTLLKTVASSTAVLGSLLLFIHLRRRSSREKTGESSRHSSQIKKAYGGTLSSRKEQKRDRVNGVYPAEKLKFGF